MNAQSYQKWSGKFLAVSIIYCVLSLTVLSGVVSLSDIEGSWRTDVILPGEIRVQSRLVVSQRGDYTEYLTNQIAGQKLNGILAGTICISNDWLILTITNDFTEHTILPRSGGAYKIISFGPQRLSLVNSNGSNHIDYLRESKVIKLPQSSAPLEKAKEIKLSSVKFDSLPLSVVITMLQKESIKRDVSHKGVPISLGPDAKQLADTEVNLELKDVTLLEALERVADSVGLEMHATDTEFLFVRKVASQ